MKTILFFLLAISISLPLVAQKKASLARQYYQAGEYEKAAELYKELHEKNRANDYYFERYFSVLMDLKKYDTAEAVTQKAIEASPEKAERYVFYGTIFERQGKMDKANAQYDKAIQMLVPQKINIIRLGYKFTRSKKYDYAIATYERGTKIMQEKDLFAYEMGSVYSQKRDIPKMVASYLKCLELTPNRLTNVQAFFQRKFSQGTGFDELKKQLYERIQKKPDFTIYPEMMYWTHIQQGDFAAALEQAKALDKRLSENGTRIYRLAQTAMREKDYETGIEAYNYIINNLGENSRHYKEAKEKIELYQEAGVPN